MENAIYYMFLGTIAIMVIMDKVISYYQIFCLYMVCRNKMRRTEIQIPDIV